MALMVFMARLAIRTRIESVFNAMRYFVKPVVDQFVELRFAAQKLELIDHTWPMHVPGVVTNETRLAAIKSGHHFVQGIYLVPGKFSPARADDIANGHINVVPAAERQQAGRATVGRQGKIGCWQRRGSTGREYKAVDATVAGAADRLGPEHAAVGLQRFDDRIFQPSPAGCCGCR